MTFISTGIRHAVGPFLKPIVADLNLDRASFSAVIAVSLFLYGVFGPLVGLALDRFGARLTASVGTILLVGSLVLTAQVRTFWEFAFVYGVILPLGLAVTGPVMASGVVARWFNKRRGTALSLLGSASMTGMSLLVPLVTWLILTGGWRTAYVAIAGLVLVAILPVALWVIRESPEQMGLTPDGVPVDAQTARAESRERVAATTAMQTLAFWQLAGSFFTCGFSMSLLSAHGVPMLTDHGFHPMTASSAIGFLGMTAIGGGLLLGFISDRWGYKPVLASVYLLRLFAFGALFFVRDPAALMVGAAIGGVGLSGSLAMTSALTSEIFGRYSVGSIFGLIFLAHQTGAALGSWLGGVLFDVTGGYGLVFAIAVALLLLAAGLSVVIDERVRPPGRTVTLPGRPYPVAGGR
jgi:MFS family permease